jgi:medium-chain acyl-[acyl-carrier-protein] hydrolase
MKQAGVMSGQDPWFSAFGASAPNFRLFCMPHAGASGFVYRRWPGFFAPDIEICALELPTRWRRIREPGFTQIAPLIAAVADAMAPRLNLPFAFYGHSFGSLVAFELARELRRRGAPGPILLSCGAANPPHRPLDFPSLQTLGDTELLEACATRYGGIDQRVFDNEDTRRLVVAPLRADMLLLENYRFSEQPPLDTPISVLAGTEDATTPHEFVSEWARHTTRRFDLTHVLSGHLFANEAPAPFASPIAAAIAAQRGSPGAPQAIARLCRRGRHE